MSRVDTGQLQYDGLRRLGTPQFLAFSNETPTTRYARISEALDNAEVKPAKEGDAGVITCTLLTVQCMVGAGMLTLPYAVSKCGFVVAAAMLFTFSTYSGSVLSMLAQCIESNINASWYSLARDTIPWRISEHLVNGVVFITAYVGGVVAYFIIVGDQSGPAFAGIWPGAPIWMKDPKQGARMFWIGCWATAYCLPLMFFKRMDSLKYTSYLGVAAIFYLTVLSVLFAFKVLDPEVETFCHQNDIQDCDTSSTIGFPTDPDAPFAFLGVAPIFVFAFNMAQQLPGVAVNLKRRTKKRMMTFIYSGMYITMAIYMLVGFCGYLVFGNLVPSDLLSAYPESTYVTIARVGMVFAVANGVIMQFLPAREIFVRMVFDEDVNKMATGKFVAVTVAMWVVGVGGSLFITDLGPVAALIGATTILSMNYFMPPWFLLSKFRNRKTWIFAAKLSIVTGLLLMPVFLTMWFLQQVNGKVPHSSEYNKPSTMQITGGLGGAYAAEAIIVFCVYRSCLGGERESRDERFMSDRPSSDPGARWDVDVPVLDRTQSLIK